MSQAHTTPALVGFLSCGQAGQRVNSEVRRQPDIFRNLRMPRRTKGGLMERKAAGVRRSCFS